MKIKKNLLCFLALLGSPWIFFTYHTLLTYPLEAVTYYELLKQAEQAQKDLQNALDDKSDAMKTSREKMIKFMNDPTLKKSERENFVNNNTKHDALEKSYRALEKKQKPLDQLIDKLKSTASTTTSPDEIEKIKKTLESIHKDVMIENVKHFFSEQITANKKEIKKQQEIIQDPSKTPEEKEEADKKRKELVKDQKTLTLREANNIFNKPDNSSSKKKAKKTIFANAAIPYEKLKEIHSQVKIFNPDKSNELLAKIKSAIPPKAPPIAKPSPPTTINTPPAPKIATDSQPASSNVDQDQQPLPYILPYYGILGPHVGEPMAMPFTPQPQNLLAPPQPPDASSQPPIMQPLQPSYMLPPRAAAINHLAQHPLYYPQPMLQAYAHPTALMSSSSSRAMVSRASLKKADQTKPSAAAPAIQNPIPQTIDTDSPAKLIKIIRKHILQPNRIDNKTNEEIEKANKEIEENLNKIEFKILEKKLKKIAKQKGEEEKASIDSFLSNPNLSAQNILDKIKELTGKNSIKDTQVRQEAITKILNPQNMSKKQKEHLETSFKELTSKIKAIKTEALERVKNHPERELREKDIEENTAKILARHAYVCHIINFKKTSIQEMLGQLMEIRKYITNKSIGFEKRIHKKPKNLINLND